MSSKQESDINRLFNQLFINGDFGNFLLETGKLFDKWFDVESNAEDQLEIVSSIIDSEYSKVF